MNEDGGNLGQSGVCWGGGQEQDVTWVRGGYIEVGQGQDVKITLPETELGVGQG